jgi:hypothetical protein
MGGWTVGGADVLLGATRSGKTTLALANQAEDVKRLGVVPITLDLESSTDWAGVPHARDADEVLEFYLVRRIPPRIWTPRDQRERDKFFSTVAHWGNAAILVDGLPMICNDQKFEEEFRKALYRWGHGRMGPTTYYLVAQRASLVHRHVFAACRRVRIFRQAPGADADRMWHEFKIPPGNPKVPGSGSTAFVRGQHETIELGFPEEN